MHFTLHQDVLFRHCDPAGIVFYPRYFEMINDTVEAFFNDLIGWPFNEMHRNGGVPTASFKVDFTKPSHHGDQLDLNLTIKRIGGSSMALQIIAVAGEETRFVADQVLVNVNETGRPTRWPDNVRKEIMNIVETPA